jgi:hypothetical protein
MSECVDSKTLAGLLKITQRSLRRLVTSGQLVPTMVYSRNLLFDEVAVRRVTRRIGEARVKGHKRVLRFVGSTGEIPWRRKTPVRPKSQLDIWWKEHILSIKPDPAAKWTPEIGMAKLAAHIAASKAADTEPKPKRRVRPSRSRKARRP